MLSALLYLFQSLLIKEDYRDIFYHPTDDEIIYTNNDEVEINDDLFY